MSVEDALVWLKQTFEPKAIELSHIVERAAYSLDRTDPIFDGLRDDYPFFDQWLDKCAREHRECWVVMVGGQMGGIVIRKDETRHDAGIVSPGNKVLKLCTFKMADQYRGEKFGEHLLKQSLWFGQVNGYDVVYLTAFADKEELIGLLQSYGFVQTRRMQNGELMFEKTMQYGEVRPGNRIDILKFDRKIYPRFYDGPSVAKYYVPIKGEYHKKLFPEISYLRPLPLFLNEPPVQAWAVKPEQERTPGNTIRKVYLSRAQAKSLRPADLLFFYLSRDRGLAASQSITTVGVVERMSECYSPEDLVRMTAKRSVFSAEELAELQAAPASPVKVMDFLLVGHSKPPVPLSGLLANRVFEGRPPQSIASLGEERYARLKPMLNLGFEV